MDEIAQGGKKRTRWKNIGAAKQSEMIENAAVAFDHRVEILHVERWWQLAASRLSLPARDERRVLRAIVDP